MVESIAVKRRIRSGEKQFAWPDCDEQFNQISGLNCHRLFHTSEKLMTGEKRTFHKRLMGIWKIIYCKVKIAERRDYDLD